MLAVAFVLAQAPPLDEIAVSGTVADLKAAIGSGADPNQVVDLHQFLPPEFISSYAVAINDAKVIAGTAIDSSGERHAVVWRPVSQFSFMFRPGFIRAAQIASAYIVLDKPAPKGGLVIRFSPTTSLNASAWSLQQEVVIAAGKTSATISVATSDRKPPKPVRVTITATMGTIARPVTLTINP